MGKDEQFAGEAGRGFPGAPKNFDPENPLADKVAAIQMREHIVREKIIKVETAKVRLFTRDASRALVGRMKNKP